MASEEGRDDQGWPRGLSDALASLDKVFTRPPDADDPCSRLDLAVRVLTSEATALIVLDPDDGIAFATPGALQLLAISGLDSAPAELLAFRSVALTGKPLFNARSEIVDARGRHRVLSIDAAPLSGNRGQVPRVALALTDLTEQYNHYERALRESEQRLKIATEAAGIGVWEYDLVQGVFHWDEQMMRIYGVEEAHCPVHYEDWLALVLPAYQSHLKDLLQEHPGYGERREKEFRIQRPDGAIRHIRAVWQSVEDAHGQPARLIGTNEDITERRNLQSELEYRAAHDPLTDLFNRAKIQQLLRTAHAAYQRHGTPYALLLFDVDHFKHVNDRFGHSAGDAVLWDMARRIEAVLRETDHMGRWGGEELLVLASQADEAGAATLAERIRQTVAATPFQGVGTVTISIGVAAVTPELGLESLEQHADLALYAAKDAGRNSVVRYSELEHGPATPL